MQISDAESVVMLALWERQPLGADEVVHAVAAGQGWQEPTVKTLLSRLVAKQAIEARPDGRRFLYSPLVARADYVGGESRRLVDRLFGGRAAPLLVHLAEAEGLTDEDLDEIERLIQELRK